MIRSGRRNSISHASEPHAVYRILGDYGRTIYVGVSHDPTARMQTHRSVADWRREIRSWEVLSWHPNLQAARPMESEAIKLYDPDHNFQHTEAALVVARTPMCDRRRVNAEVRAARMARKATERLDAAIRYAGTSADR